MTFYEGTQFPKEYRGDGFASEHGSWNRAKRTGYEVIRVPMHNGKADGSYEDSSSPDSPPKTATSGPPRWSGRCTRWGRCLCLMMDLILSG